MARKRKRPARDASFDERPCKRRAAAVTDAHHPVLSLYYPKLLSLRQYLLGKMSSHSKARRRRIAALSTRPSACGRDDSVADVEPELAKLLDSTLVGVCGALAGQAGHIQADVATISQHQANSTCGSSTAGACSQSEVSPTRTVLAFAYGSLACGPRHLVIVRPSLPDRV